MRGNNERNSKESNSKGTTVSETTAFALGHITAWLEQFSISTGVPYPEVADGVFEAMADARNRSSVPLLEVQSGPSPEPQILQPEMALASGTREPRQLPQTVIKAKAKQYALNYKVRMYRKTHTLKECATHYGVTESRIKTIVYGSYPKK